MTLAEWLQIARERLEAAGVESAALDAQLLAGHVLLADRTWILSHGEIPFPELAGETLLQRRLAREPLAYILGYREFYGRKFIVTPDVLVPRQDTETLVDVALTTIRGRSSGPTSVLDLCSGSGCIGITIALEATNCSVTLSDISTGANQVATENANALRADVAVVKGDLFAAIGTTHFDLVVCNPPYISREEDLQTEVQLYEPEIALWADDSGFSFHVRLASEARDHLTDSSVILLEVGHQQAQSVKNLFAEAGWPFLNIYKDLSGIERVVGASFTPGVLP